MPVLFLQFVLQQLLPRVMRAAYWIMWAQRGCNVALQTTKNGAQQLLVYFATTTAVSKVGTLSNPPLRKRNQQTIGQFVVQLMLKKPGSHCLTGLAQSEMSSRLAHLVFYAYSQCTRAWQAVCGSFPDSKSGLRTLCECKPE